MSLASAPNYSQTIASLPDITSTITPTACDPLSCGPSGGILVTAHPSNGSVVIRVSGSDSSGSDVSATQGQPLAAGSSYTFAVSNASQLYHCTESSTGRLCVTGV